MSYVEYDSNNSGGSWWLSSKDWKALENAGWIVHWVDEAGNPYNNSSQPLEPRKRTGNTWLGAEATTAAKETNDFEGTVNEWARITHQDPGAQGCNCCGPPHSFSFHRDDGEVDYPRRYTESWIEF